MRRAVAAAFQHIDAHQFGYDHGFCADPDADPETAAFVDAAIRVVLTIGADEVLRVAFAQEGPALQWNWWDAATIPESAAQLLRDMADNPKES
jgi:hypothetical protein